MTAVSVTSGSANGHDWTVTTGWDIKHESFSNNNGSVVQTTHTTIRDGIVGRIEDVTNGPPSTSTSAAAGITNPLKEEEEEKEHPHPHQHQHDPQDDRPTPLLHAIQQRNLPLTLHLLSPPNPHNPNPPPLGFYGRTPLQTASLLGDLPLIRALLSAGADANAPGGNNGGLRALALAARAGHREVVDVLLDPDVGGAEVNAPPARYMGRTALQAACEGGDVHVVRRLVEVGAAVDAPAAWSSGRTALQAAAEGGHGEVVRVLLGVGGQGGGRFGEI
ncbi:predicted protein [Chaetomium globosum CBS 148.51]|uniref:Uncharacterized protein n=1 Tax=Chaetomium globosum (strain ATCC 6205 / CBS 148.51 / DSM 1962 / NBRC 6347 / NRRL 1970) TaxID=306901 RepID=Q2H244_CHAGB|nr:uncharacterized protein CHGG_04152 [Chaetomium globosum CBS 148.51]EAQ87533.1 predicted protein [Chaetomium globosum CBS 148.51]